MKSTVISCLSASQWCGGGDVRARVCVCVCVCVVITIVTTFATSLGPCLPKVVQEITLIRQVDSIKELSNSNRFNDFA